jgi:beta-lactamase class A
MRSGPSPRLLLLAALVAMIAIPAAQTRTPTPADSNALEARLRAIIAASGAEVAVAFKTLDGSAQTLIDPDLVFHAASTMKVPVMFELF